MYRPLVQTLIAGASATIANRSHWQVKSHVVPYLSPAEVNATTSRTRWAALAALRARDIFVWIGIASSTAVPFKKLQERGVLTVYYQTEPHSESWPCEAPATVDEVWDYSRRNIALCVANMSHRSNRPTFRYVPPGLLDEAPPAQQHLSATLAFLGATLFGNRSSCWQWLAARLGKRLRRVNGTWTRAQAARVGRQHGIYLNLHKSCGGEATQPLESFRFSQLLSSSAIVVSEPCAEIDEAEYRGMALFAPLSAIPATFEKLANLTRNERRRLAHSHAQAFAHKFTPAALFSSAGVGALISGP